MCREGGLGDLGDLRLGLYMLLLREEGGERDVCTMQYDKMRCMYACLYGLYGME